MESRASSVAYMQMAARWSAELEGTSLYPQQVSSLRARLVPAAHRMRRRLRILGVSFYAGRILVSVTSLLAPSAVTLQPGDLGERGQSTVRWLTWSLGLLKSVANAALSLFHVDRSYAALSEQCGRLETEMWLYLQLAGRYAKGGHRDQLSEFVERFESILSKSVRIERPDPAAARESVVPSLKSSKQLPRSRSAPALSSTSKDDG